MCIAAQYGQIQTVHAAPHLRGKCQCRQWIVKSLRCCRHDGLWQMKLPVDQGLCAFLIAQMFPLQLQCMCSIGL